MRLHIAVNLGIDALHVVEHSRRDRSPPSSCMFSCFYVFSYALNLGHEIGALYVVEQSRPV